MSTKQYYTLISSLPHLLPMEKSKELPISWIQLQKRRTLLEEEDSQMVDSLQQLLAWYYHPSTQRDSLIIQRYESFMTQTKEHPKIQDIVTEIFKQRTVVAAFRMKYTHIHFSNHQQIWGLQEDKHMIEHFWDEDDFKLSYKYPWVKEVKRFFMEDNPLGLTESLMRSIWKKADILKFEHPFSLDAYVAYLIQWATLQKWLTFEPKKAALHFDHLLLEACHDYK